MCPVIKDASVISRSNPLAKDASLIRGTFSLSRDKLKEFAPHYTGQTQIFVLKNIKYMEDSIGEGKIHADNLKILLEYGSLSYSGTPDMTLNTNTIETGVEGRQIEVATTTTIDGQSFSIRVFEKKDEPLRRALEYYARGLSDHLQPWSHMHGSELDFAPENYTMEILIVHLNPKLDKIQQIDLWQNAIPKPVDRDNLNWQQGQIEVLQPKDVQFTGNYYPDADQLFEKAKALVNGRLALYKKSTEVIL
jgi:hypothetical protein